MEVFHIVGLLQQFLNLVPLVSHCNILTNSGTFTCLKSVKILVDIKVATFKLALSFVRIYLYTADNLLSNLHADDTAASQ